MPYISLSFCVFIPGCKIPWLFMSLEYYGLFLASEQVLVWMEGMTSQGCQRPYLLNQDETLLHLAELTNTWENQKSVLMWQQEQQTYNAWVCPLLHCLTQFHIQNIGSEIKSRQHSSRKPFWVQAPVCLQRWHTMLALFSRNGWRARLPHSEEIMMCWPGGGKKGCGFKYKYRWERISMFCSCTPPPHLFHPGQTSETTDAAAKSLGEDSLGKTWNLASKASTEQLGNRKKSQRKKKNYLSSYHPERVIVKILCDL